MTSPASSAAAWPCGRCSSKAGNRRFEAPEYQSEGSVKDFALFRENGTHLVSTKRTSPRQTEETHGAPGAPCNHPHPDEVFAMHAAPSATAANVPTPEHNPDTPAATGRDSHGRFAPGNPGGPGNPFYRRQAEFRRAALAAFTPEDVASLLRVMLALGRNGDTAAARVFLDYAVGKPAKAAEPDQADLHEWQLHQQTPRLAQVMDVMANSIETTRANQVTREVVPIVGDCHLKTLGQHLHQGTDYAGRQIAPPLEAKPPAADPNGGKRSSLSARRMTADVPPTVPTEDNGEKAAAWHNRLDEAIVQAVQTGDIGALLAHLRPGPHGGASPAEDARPGSD
jgi:hypothetical protein